MVELNKKNQQEYSIARLRELLPSSLHNGMRPSQMSLSELRDYFADYMIEDRKRIPDDIRTFNQLKQEGKGADELKQVEEAGMSGENIETVLKQKLHRYIPVIASNEIPTLLPFVNKHTKEFSFIINSEPSSESGAHWRSVYISRAKAEIDFYDSLVSEPSAETLRGLKQLTDKMDDHLMYKLKINRVKEQSDTSSTCGAWALHFLDRMNHGAAFKDASGYTDHIQRSELVKKDESVEGEKRIARYISKWQYM